MFFAQIWHVSAAGVNTLVEHKQGSKEQVEAHLARMKAEAAGEGKLVAHGCQKTIYFAADGEVFVVRHNVGAFAPTMTAVRSAQPVVASPSRSRTPSASAAARPRKRPDAKRPMAARVSRALAGAKW